MEWLRWYHGAISDDKWPLIARKSGQPVAVVIAVWASLLECASQAEDRGSLADFDPESIDALLQIQDGATQAVIDALSGGKKPRIQQGKIVNWVKRQPQREREDSKSTDRVRQHRERQKMLQDNDSDTCNAYETPVKHHETPVKHHETPRVDKRREEEIRNTNNLTLDSTSRAHDQRGGVCESDCPEQDNSPPHLEKAGDDPGIDFLEVREFYSENARSEAPLEGYPEFKQAIAGRDWPGMSRFCQAVSDLSELDGQWRDGFAPGLAKFIRTRGWEKPPVPAKSRASPVRSSPDALTEQNMNTAAKVLSRRAARDKERFGNDAPA